MTVLAKCVTKFYVFKILKKKPQPVFFKVVGRVISFLNWNIPTKNEILFSVCAHCNDSLMVYKEV